MQQITAASLPIHSRAPLRTPQPVDANGNTVTTNMQPEAVLLDTLNLPTRGQVITRLALVIGAALVGLLLMLLSLPASRSE